MSLVMYFVVMYAMACYGLARHSPDGMYRSVYKEPIMSIDFTPASEEVTMVGVDYELYTGTYTPKGKSINVTVEAKDLKSLMKQFPNKIVGDTFERITFDDGSDTITVPYNGGDAFYGHK
ncbi:hypothetical protein FOL47_004474 [Perkinsus chesapeaki]|uniref:Uncharacterized protein n=1 Tax=Perkinsus chesapeaki TaxID=330153 RepID=A0A7J6M288_PERCH|nr:hypothetical protein FOL47_004474 [Perkinsus chesapeaki]